MAHRAPENFTGARCFLSAEREKTPICAVAGRQSIPHPYPTTAQKIGPSQAYSLMSCSSSKTKPMRMPGGLVMVSSPPNWPEKPCKSVMPRERLCEGS